MGAFSFPLLYAACLAVCIGTVEVLRLGWEPPPPPPEPEPEESLAIAVPPRPEGARQIQGEGDEVYRYTEEKCRALDGDYRDICFTSLAQQRAPTDLEGGLAACDMVEDREKSMECKGYVAEGYAPADREAALAVCPTIPKKKWRDQCVFGIALSLSTLDSPWAFRLCDDAGKWRDFCRHDVNGEIAQVNHDLALEHCAAEEGDLLRRKSCWHGIGKYIARVDVDRAFRVCEEVPLGPSDLYRENCVHGLGWGASETAGAAFVPECSRAGEKEDSCKLGVAYNLRRFDIPAGLEICASVERADLREQCNKFVSEGRL